MAADKPHTARFDSLAFAQVDDLLHKAVSHQCRESTGSDPGAARLISSKRTNLGFTEVSTLTDLFQQYCFAVVLIQTQIRFFSSVRFMVRRL